MDQAFKQQVCQALGVADVVERETIQGLWGGYGKIARYALVGGALRGGSVTDGPVTDGSVTGGPVSGGPLPGGLSRVVIKHVRVPAAAEHPRGWNTDRSHKRKIRSYAVESAWYASWSRLCPEACRVPRYMTHASCGPETLLVLEDLDASGYPIRKTRVTLAEVNAAVDWLAHFHAAFMHQPPQGLWETGTYWHLDTRRDELAAMQDRELQQAAGRIDRALTSSRFQTLVHGDAKLANFCFSVDGQVAAVDFQYVGGGCGMKDLAYFIGSCLDSDQCSAHEAHVLDRYFGTLAAALRSGPRRGPRRGSRRVDPEALEADWRRLYPYAWADFQRFLDGWSPGHWKLGAYSDRMTRQVLADCAG